MSVGSERDGRPWSKLKKSTSVSDGVVLIDPEYLKERKGDSQSGVQTLRQVAGPASYLVSFLSVQSLSP